MNKLLSLLKYAPKRTAAVVMMITSTIVVSTSLLAYGPTNRNTFTYENPAPYVTFDSITDNPNVGDERNFVRIKEAGDSNTYGENVNVQAGHTYQVMVYYHNNASTELNASGVGIAHDVMLRMQMAANVAAGQSTNVTGFIDSSNASPTEVWDSASLTNTTAGTMDLSFVAGSAKVTSNGAVNGATLPNTVFSTGTPLGYNALDGTLPGCNQYAGYVVFDVVANQPNFTVQKQVSVDGGNTWVTNATTTPGSTVLYRIIYTNTGTTEQTDVTVKDTLPAGVTYVPGSTQIVNSVTNAQWQATSDGLTTTGLNIGAYAPNGGNAGLKFSAKVPTVDQLSCGVNTLDNTARVTTPNGYKESSADLTVNKTCAPVPAYVCTSLTTTLVSGTQYKFNGVASASNGASIVNYVINFGDGTSQPATNPTNILHTYPTTGKSYSPSLIVNVNVNGTIKQVTSAGCTTAVTIGTPPVTPPTITPPTVTPALLPHTGPTENIVAFLGLGALIASVIYYVRSRRVIA